MPVALVTGEAMEAAAVSAGFERHGFEVHVAAPWGSNRLPAGGIDCYVQLPGRGCDQVSTMPAAASLGRGYLVGRLDLLALLARRLSPLATVLLAVEEPDPFHPGSPHDLLAALAAVVLEDAGRPNVRVVVLPAEELGASRVEVVLGETAAPVAALSA